MFDLTPGERRGVLVLLSLVALGAAADVLWRAPVPAPAPATPAAAPAGPAGSTAPAPAAPAGAGAAAPLDLNTAGEAELDRLPGIGPVLAARIVAHRRAHGPFRDPAELLAVPGIGPRLHERLAPLVTAGPVAGRTAPRVQNARVRSR